MPFTSFIVSILAVATAAHTGFIQKVSPRAYVVSPPLSLPKEWDWGDVDGKNYLTKSLNQHIPQYCGSCWAHGAVSALGDRLKIARNATQPDINLAVQFLLNCGDAGSCKGGDHLAAYRFIKKYGGIPFDTCLAYEACSTDSPAKACNNRDFSCQPINTCRTCFSDSDGGCKAIQPYPNATIESYGAIQGHEEMMKEIYKNGPIACGVNAGPILNYSGGILDVPHEDTEVDHIISIVGWGYNGNKQYWKIRNSWGEYWGELGYFRVVLGENQLGLETDCAWAKPGRWTEHNKPCFEDGGNCITSHM